MSPVTVQIIYDLFIDDGIKVLLSWLLTFRLMSLCLNMSGRCPAPCLLLGQSSERHTKTDGWRGNLMFFEGVWYHRILQLIN